MRAPAVEAMLEIDERHWWWVGRRRILRDQIRRLALPAGASLLDAGCGSGADLEMLSEFGAVSGIDLSEQAAAHARERGVGEVRVGPIEELPWAEASFDLVTCLDVLEHIRDDRGALRELRRVTRPSGRLVLTVPAYQVLWSAHDVDNGHCRRYGRRALREAAREAGWKVERLTSFNMLLLLPAAILRLARRRSSDAPRGRRSEMEITPRWLDGALLMPLRIEGAALRRGARLPAGLSLLAVLRNS